MKNTPHSLVASATVLLALIAAQSIQAASYTYTATGVTNWSAGLWTGGTPASNLDNRLFFSAATGQRMVTTNDLGAGFQLNGLSITNTSSSTNNQAFSIAGNSLNFVKDSSDALPTVTLARNTVNGGSITLSAAFTVTDALTITNNANTSTAATTISSTITNTAGITFNGSGGATVTFGGSGAISGAGGIRHNGSYRINVTGSGAKSYTGDTRISNGTFNLGVNLTGTNAVIVDGGTLTSSVANVDLGVGAVSLSSGVVDAGGTGSAGSFTLAANQIFTATGGTLNFDLISSISFDQILGSGSGTFSLTGTTLALSGLTSATGTYQLFAGFASGSVSGLTITGLDAGLTGSLDSSGLLTISAVPEPSSYAAFAGILSFAWIAARRNRRTAA